MERDFDCIACAAPFKVMNEVMRTETPEVALDVSCPLCKSKQSHCVAAGHESSRRRQVSAAEKENALTEAL